ncbi:MAG: nucleoside hydrolase [Proteobacteria bacterium]|nr:nucleoside hydrolase [Pseudomonadota bacterium]
MSLLLAEAVEKTPRRLGRLRGRQAPPAHRRRRKPASRSLRHRLSAQAGAVRRPEADVAIDTKSALNLGRTVVDWWGVTGKAANATVIDGIDADGFFALLTERLARL